MSGPEAASSRPTDNRSPSVPRMRLQRQLFCYLVVGGLTVVVDIGLLALLHESYGVPLGLATTVAFGTAVVVNFLLNRTAMSSWGSRGLTQHALRYGSLVVANYVITLAVVTTAGHVGDRYLVAKVAVVAGSTSWNFLLYRHWVFTPPRPTSSKQDRVPLIGRNPRHRDGRSVQPSRQMLVVVPAYIDEESIGSPGDRGSRREGLLGGSGATGKQDPGHEHQA
jgi:putative flippase GtrA